MVIQFQLDPLALSLLLIPLLPPHKKDKFLVFVSPCWVCADCLDLRFLRGGMSESKPGKGAAAAFEPPPPPSGYDRCWFYQVKKRRYCRGVPVRGTKFCGHHAPLSSSGASRRIPCPIDPSHTVDEAKLEKHLKVCPKAVIQRKLEGMPFYCKGCNSVPPPIADCAVAAPPSMPAVSIPTAVALAKAIVRAFGVIFPKGLETKDLSEPELKAGFKGQLARRRVALGGEKHILQIASLVGHMRDWGMLPAMEEGSPASAGVGNVKSVLEMGAGRGMLGYVVSGVAATEIEETTAKEGDDSSGGSNVELVMVERSSSRRKSDTRVRNDLSSEEGVGDAAASKFRFNSASIVHTRIRCDLQHVYLPSVIDDLRDKEGNIVVAAKHLCGVGTDLALRAVEKIRGNGRLKGVAFATCCHGVCDFDNLAGKEFFIEMIKGAGGFEASLGGIEFKMIAKWTGASTSDRKGATDSSSEHKEAPVDFKSRPGIQEGRLPGVGDICDGSIGFTKQELARCCQRLIDQARVMYLREKLGFPNATLKYYVGEDVTPQNALLIAFRNSESSEEEKQRLTNKNKRAKIC